MNHFQGNKDHPQHVSVGAIVVNGKGEVCCHHFTDADLEGYWPNEGLNDFYLLMRETVSQDETLERALTRGLKEEFGVEARMVDYVGSIQSHFKHEGVTVEKTTLYFYCMLVSQDAARRDTSDIEGKSALEWHTLDFLIPHMKEQAKRYGRTDVDESSILERVKSLRHL